MKNNIFLKYKDKHAGERVFLIANGPSLANTDLDFLKNENTIAMNRISLIYDKNPTWRPTYYLFSSTNVLHPVWGPAWTKSVRESIKEERTTSFISSKFRNAIDPDNALSRARWFDSMSENKPAKNGNILSSCFSTDVIDRIDKSGTTMNLALQLVYHMGFSEVVILGADLGWTGDRGSKNGPSHFDTSYQADIPHEKVYKINNQMRNVHSLAIQSLHKKNNKIKMYNASLKTKLDVYPIIDYKSYIIDDKILYRDRELKEAMSFWDKPAQYASLTKWEKSV